MTIIFKPANELTFDSVEEVRQRFLVFCKQLESRSLSLDLAEVVVCDSAGLAFLIEAKRIALSYNLTCEFSDLGPRIMALAKFCGVNNLLC